MENLPIIEIITAISAASGGILAAGVKAYRVVNKRIAERDKAIVKSLSKVIAKSVHDEVETGLEARSHTRQAQITATKKRLSNYGSCVTRSAGEAVREMVCSVDCKALSAMEILYTDAVMSTFLTDVLDYFITDVISKNGFLKRNEHEFEAWVNEVRAEAFAVFLCSMRRRFRHEEIQVRIDWIEENMDRIFMRAIVHSIMVHCRELSAAYHWKRAEHASGLAEKIERDIIALQ